MKSTLTSYLRCPNCRGILSCQSSQVDETVPWVEIIEGRLDCPACGRHYPIQRGIPRLLLHESSSAVESTIEGFGFEWSTFNEQIQSSYMTSKTNFLDFIYPTQESFFEGRVVLDAGCGMGRFLKLGAEFGSREIIGIDLSSAVEVAYENTRLLPNAHVVQADILSLPFSPEFDFIFSVGVLQFIEEPQAGFNALTALLNEKGRISVWVYSAENNGWVTALVSPVRCYVTSRLPRPVLYKLSRGLGYILYAIVHGLYKPANEGIFGFRFGRFLPYNRYLYYTSQLNYPSLVSVIFDHLVPQVVRYISKNEFEMWFETANLHNVVISSRNNMSWRGQGERFTAFSGVS